MSNAFSKKNIRYTRHAILTKKVYYYDNKSKTRGIMLAASNCGIVLSYRKLRYTLSIK